MLSKIIRRCHRVKRRIEQRNSKQYRQYIGWSFASNIAISAQSVLSTHSMLSVIGKASSEITASYNYVGKDIIGQTAGLWYMNKMGKEADKRPKKFVNRSMMLQQSAIALESITPMLPLKGFLPIAGVSNTAKNISFAGFGAINAKVIQKIAGSDQIGEVYSQIAMVNTIGSSIGMGLGLLIAAKIPSHTVRTYTVIPILGCIRYYTFNRAIKNLV